MKKILNKCPICGSKLEYAALQQYSNVYDVLKNGMLSVRRKRKEDVGSMDCGYLYCTKPQCYFRTDVDFNSEEYPDIEIYQDGDRYYYERRV